MRQLSCAIFLCLLFTVSTSVLGQKATQGELNALGVEGKALGACPLKSTDVQAEITGFLSRVKVRQEFQNNFAEKIEAVYVFPLPNNAAVDDMTMRIGPNGERVVRGKIMKREEARAVYNTAKSSGQIASLLDQERPNIFTQSVANILPGEKIVIEISYIETLKYEAGSYEFVFPMVVAPRYMPSANKSANAANINPPMTIRAGHDISISVRLDAGVPVDSIASKSHQIVSAARSASSFDVSLKNEKTIPNKDFILRFDVAGKKISDAVLTHRSDKGGYFTLILQPPDRVDAKDVTPKEIVFVLDTSGSMDGFPLDKAKESMKMALAGLHPQDTFNLITFAGDTDILFDQPVPATPGNLKIAQDFLKERDGGGGTEMMTAIKAALEPSVSQIHTRIVCFMTDGQVGNDEEIIEEIQKNGNARVFSFGIGDSVNRHLLDKMASEGRGEVEYVSLKDDGSAAAKRFHERVRSPLLTDVSVDYGSLPVADIYPRRINDLFSAKPVIVHGRFTGAGSGVIKLRGYAFGREVVREIPVSFPENEPGHDALAALWARTRIDDLMSLETSERHTAESKDELAKAITNLGIEYRLMTQYTSFVAVEERVVTDTGEPRKVDVPVNAPPETITANGNASEVIATKNGTAAVGTVRTSSVNGLPKSGVAITVDGIDVQDNLLKSSNGFFTSTQPVVNGAANSNAVVAGAVTETVTVTSSAEVLQTTNASVGTSISGRQITETPLQSRDALDLVTTLPVNGRSYSLMALSSGATKGNGTRRSANDPRNTAPTVGAAYKNWVANDVAYLISADDKRELRDSAIKVASLTIPQVPALLSKTIKPGTIGVGVTLDGGGNIVKAEVNMKEAGKESFEKLLEDAARSAKFELPKSVRNIEKITGQIVFNFTKDKKLEVATRLFNTEITVKTNKYHWAVAGVAERLKTGKPSPSHLAFAESRFVSAGKANLIVRLDDVNAENLAALKAAGLEFQKQDGNNSVTGRVAIDKIAALHDMKEVMFIAPQN